MDRGAWQATVHGVTNNWKQLKQQLLKEQKSLIQINLIHQFVIYVILISKKDLRWQKEGSKS